MKNANTFSLKQIRGNTAARKMEPTENSLDGRGERGGKRNSLEGEAADQREGNVEGEGMWVDLILRGHWEKNGKILGNKEGRKRGECQEARRK